MSSQSSRKKRRVADADARPESQAQAPPDDELGLYADKKFWQDRYERERERELGSSSRDSTAGGALFEWYAPWSSVRELVRAVVPDLHGAVLELGCGSSTLALDMHRDGYTDVLAVDFAPAAVEVSNELARAAGVSLGTRPTAGAVADASAGAEEAVPGLRFEVMDVRELSLEASSVECVIDKATVDAILCAADGAQNVLRVASEVDRMLRMGGVFIIVSHINPDPDSVPGADEDEEEDSSKPMAAAATCGLDWLSSAILPAFDWVQARWTVDVHSMPDEPHMPHLYVLRKHRRAQTRSAADASMLDVCIELHEH